MEERRPWKNFLLPNEAIMLTSLVVESSPTEVDWVADEGNSHNSFHGAVSPMCAHFKCRTPEIILRGFHGIFKWTCSCKDQSCDALTLHCLDPKISGYTGKGKPHTPARHFCKELECQQHGRRGKCSSALFSPPRGRRAPPASFLPPRSPSSQPCFRPTTLQNPDLAAPPPRAIYAQTANTPAST